MAEEHLQLPDSDFISQFEDCSLDPSLFTHEAHLRLAWIYIMKHGPEKAEEYISAQIQRFDSVHGDGKKYHKTLTIASIKVVDHFIQKSQSDNFSDFINEFLRLKTNFKDLLDYHYGIDIYNSPVAKEEYIKPDLDPF